jgi:hypothetical protein
MHPVLLLRVEALFLVVLGGFGFSPPMVDGIEQDANKAKQSLISGVGPRWIDMVCCFYLLNEDATRTIKFELNCQHKERRYLGCMPRRLSHTEPMRIHSSPTTPAYMKSASSLQVDAGKISWRIIVSHILGDGFALTDIETELLGLESKGVGGLKGCANQID